MREEGFKATPQRCAILGLFEKVGDHLTPQEVYQRLEGSVESLSLATVYNSLEMFEKVGILTRFCTEQGHTYYDPNPDPHHHALCEGCGAIYDMEIPEATMKQLMGVLDGHGAREMGFRIRETRLWFRGLCGSCQ
jgi:Fur family peroxide stress response transcriptional regulator